MSEISRGSRATNPLPSQQRPVVQGASQASLLADEPFVGGDGISSCGSTQNTPAVTRTNTEPIRRAPLDRWTRFLSLPASWEDIGASSSTAAPGRVCVPPLPTPVSASIELSPQGLRSGNQRDNSREASIISAAADARPVSPPPLSYLASQRFGAGGTAHQENTMPFLSPRPTTALTIEDLLETDLFEGLLNDSEMTDTDARLALPEGAETCDLPSRPQESRPEASEALDCIFNVNPDPFGVDGEGFFPALASTIPPPPALTFFPLGSQSGFSAAREIGAIPLPIDFATDTPPPAALLIDPQVTLAPPLASEASYTTQQDPPLPGCHENLAAVGQNLPYSSRRPVPRFRTMSHDPWVVPVGDIPIISGASMAGGHSTVVRDRNFGSPSLDGPIYMGTDGIKHKSFFVPAITRPGFSDETLLSHSGTDRMQEWAGSAYYTSEPPVPSLIDTRCSSGGEQYLDPAGDSYHLGLSRESTEPLSRESYPTDPLRIGEPLASNLPPPPAIHSRATYSSYPPLPLPLREQTYRPWSMDVSEDGIQFISLEDCELSMPSERVGDRASAGAWTCWPGGRLNAGGGRALKIGDSKSATGFATPPVEVLEEYIDSGDSSSQQPATKKQRTSQQKQETYHTPVEISTDVCIVDGSLFTGGKSIPGWMPKAVAAEEVKGDAGARREQTMTPTKRDLKTQQTWEVVPHGVMKTSTTAGEELTLTGSAGVTPTDDSTLYRSWDEDKVDDDSVLISGERAVTTVSRRLTPVVEIIVPAVPRGASNVLLTGAKPVPEKRRSRGRPRKVVVLDEAVAFDENTITDAGLYTGPVVALGWLVPYKRGEPICLPGCESLPETIGCLRCFDRRFPGRREREGLVNPEMVFRRLHPSTSSTASSPRNVQEVQGLHGLLGMPKASVNKRVSSFRGGREPQGAGGGKGNLLPIGGDPKRVADKRFLAYNKAVEAKAQSSLSDPPSRRKTPTPPRTGLSERPVRKRPLTPGEPSGVRVVGRWSVPPSWEPPLTRAAAEASSLPTAKAVSTLTATRRSSLSNMQTKNTSPALRERRSTISTPEPQALERQTLGPASSRKTGEFTPARRNLRARDSSGKFSLLACKTADISASTVEVNKTPKRTLRSRSNKPPAEEKPAAVSSGGNWGSTRGSSFSNFRSRNRSKWQSGSGSEDGRILEDNPEGEDSSEYKA